jgi:hypothetical protein
MRKLLSGGLAVVAGMVSLPAQLSVQKTERVPAPDYRSDPRSHSIRRFFARFECPAQDYSRAFVEIADAYNLDWRLLPSISYIESTGGKNALNNNLFGWDSGRARFASPVAGIREVAYRLAHSELYRNKNVDEILAIYNPVPNYVFKVKSVMRLIAAE